MEEETEGVLMRRLLAGLAALGLAACTAISSPAPATNVTAASSEIEDRSEAEILHFSTMVLDSHLDTPIYFHTENYNFSRQGDFDIDGTHVDLPRMREGGLTGGFWVIFIPQGPLDSASYQAARNAAIMRQVAIREMAAKYHEDVELAFTADDADRIFAEGRKIVFQSLENSYPLGEDLSLLTTLYIGGLRMVAPVHFRNNQFADSSTDSTIAFGGLSPFGEDLIREANRLGMIVDGSHASDDAVRDMLAVSSTPLILSHSGPKGIFDHPRNLPDDLLIEIAEGGGVIQVNAFGGYLERLIPSPERLAAIAALEAEYGRDPSEMDEATRNEFRARLRQLNRTFPPPRSTYEKFLEHLFYMLDLVGPDHVGIGADWDGGGGVDGMKDVTFLPRITEDLLAAGYSHEDIRKIWGGNMMRLLREVEAAREVDIPSPGILN